MKTTMRQIVTACSFAFAVCSAGAAFADSAMDPALAEKATQAVDKGLSYLRSTQAEDGSWSKSVGVTALALRAFIESPHGYSEKDGPLIVRPAKYLTDHVQADGSIGQGDHDQNYNTAVAVVALEATKNPAYADAIKGAQNFLAGHQTDEGEGADKSQKHYGGFGYQGNERPDLSNTYMALEALKATAYDPQDPVWQKALTFVSRCQNNSETNDQKGMGNDGGFTYMPGYSPYGGAGSYGAMTSAGLLSLLFAGVDKNDPRVQAAYNWIRANYTLETNPGTKDNAAQFYYYNVFSKAMAAYDEPELKDTAGNVHDWRNDLATKLISLQDPDGSWVNKTSTRWWEGDRNLVTAWSVIALDQALKK